MWIWAVEDGVTEEDAAPYELITFEGGLYAAAMSVDGDGESYAAVYQAFANGWKAAAFCWMSVQDTVPYAICSILRRN